MGGESQTEWGDAHPKMASVYVSGSLRMPSATTVVRSFRVCRAENTGTNFYASQVLWKYLA